MIDQKTLKQLIKLMVDNDLTELDLEDGQQKIKLRRGPGESQVHFIGPSVNTAAPPPKTPPTETVLAAAQPAADHQSILSPMVGTFYAAPSPDAKAFVAIGDRVGPETVVCIIEAMKVFNEIKAEVSGTIEKILVTNSQAVEFEQPLFLVKPD